MWVGQPVTASPRIRMSFMITFRLRQHQIAAITCIGLGILAGHVQHPGMVEGGETVGGSSSGGELSTGGARPR
jgi:hypothetical protein